jgi:hypothetical protein
LWRVPNKGVTTTPNTTHTPDTHLEEDVTHQYTGSEEDPSPGGAGRGVLEREDVTISIMTPTTLATEDPPARTPQLDERFDNPVTEQGTNETTGYINKGVKIVDKFRKHHECTPSLQHLRYAAPQTCIISKPEASVITDLKVYCANPTHPPLMSDAPPRAASCITPCSDTGEGP